MIVLIDRRKKPCTHFSVMKSPHQPCKVSFNRCVYLPDSKLVREGQHLGEATNAFSNFIPSTANLCR